MQPSALFDLIYTGAQSVCECGHAGEGGATMMKGAEPSRHAGATGRGFCMDPACTCMKFQRKAALPCFLRVRETFLKTAKCS